MRPIFTCLALPFLLLPSAVSQSGEIDGWSVAHWGMTEKEVLATFRGAAVRLRGSRLDRQYGERLATVGIESTSFHDVPLRAHFFFDPVGGLDRVLLRPATSQRPENEIWFRQVEDSLEREYGKPTIRGVDKEGIEFASAWIFPKTVIELHFIDAGTSNLWVLMVYFEKQTGQSADSILGNRLSPVRGRHFPKRTFTLIKPVEADDLAIENDAIAVSFKIARGSIEFAFQNKTQSPVKLDWDQISFLETDGMTSKVIHAGVRFIERDRPQPPTVVPPGAKIADSITPSNRIQYQQGWKMLPLFPERGPAALALCGKTFQLFMPLQIDKEVANYSFEFRIDCAE